MRTLEELELELIRILETVPSSKLEVELILEIMYKLGAIAAYIQLTQSVIKEAELLLKMIQKSVRSASSSPVQH